MMSVTSQSNIFAASGMLRDKAYCCTRKEMPTAVITVISAPAHAEAGGIDCADVFCTSLLLQY